MKDVWKFCQCCYFNGRCENQDRGMKCETYPKQLEDKVERLQEQLKEANRIIKRELRRQSPKGGVLLCDMNDYLKKWGVK